MSRAVNSLRLVVPALWMGMVLGLSFIETPLKFLAPGITVPLGLGIGRLVFNALTIAGVVFFVVLVLLAAVRPRENRAGWMLVAASGVVLAVQSLVIRPALNARSDVIIAGGDPGESSLHYGYIAAELVLLVALAAYIVHVARAQRAPVASAG